VIASGETLNMHKLLLDIPTRVETERLYLRCYRAGDGPWYYEISQRNKPHLARYESGNAVMTINTEEDAEITVRDFAVAWMARDAFFLGVFRRDTHEFVAQIYVGVVNWHLPEFEIGYFADVGHEGQGYVAEAARAALRFAFEHLGAHRVRLECDDTNVRSMRVAERCGMIKEGHIRENKRNADGSISGTLHYGILREEFEKNPETGDRVAPPEKSG
jgi:ribosomal-protein-alanine N-acetyltransferase